MKNVSTDTWVRLAVFAVTIINQILVAAGKNPIPASEDELYTTLSTVATIAASLWAAWKDNPVTAKAQLSNEVMAALKDGELTEDSVQELLNNQEV